jgi:hypothetical protein
MELSEKCAAVLAKPPTKEECYDFRAVRRRAICTAWKILEEEKIPFREAIKRGWAETKAKCREISAVI